MRFRGAQTKDDVLPTLSVERVSVRFGGLLAVDDVSIKALNGTVTGLIGPNGAGKTTLFNACTGGVRATEGSVFLGEARLDHLSTSARAARGLGRTYQRMELFDSMTVAENVALGPEAMFSARRPWGQLTSSPGQRRDIALRTDDALGRCGLGGLKPRTVGDLSTGQRRLVELARAIATPFRFVLLDEPSSGLDSSETSTFARVLSEFIADTGIGVLLVEHDMELVSMICSYIWVLDFGRMITSGPTETVLRSPEVQAAYLGSESLDEMLSEDEPSEVGAGTREGLLRDA